MKIEEYLNLPYKIIMEVENSSGKIVSIVPELPGCKSYGGTEAEAYINIKKEMKKYIEKLLTQNKEVPLPQTTFKEYCPNCNKITSQEVKQIENKDTIVKGVKIPPYIENISFCNECGEEVFIEAYDDENLLKAFLKYEEITGEKVKAIYTKLNGK